MTKKEKMGKRVLLMILDGWGIGKKDKTNAIYTQGQPNIEALMEKYPHSQLMACGEDVGLPAGQMGNSEVGHLNMLQRGTLSILWGLFRAVEYTARWNIFLPFWMRQSRRACKMFISTALWTAEIQIPIRARILLLSWSTI